METVRLQSLVDAAVDEAYSGLSGVHKKNANIKIRPLHNPILLQKVTKFYYRPVKTLSNTADTTDAATDLQQLATVSLTDDCDIESCKATTATSSTTNTTNTVATTSTHSTSSLTNGLRAALIGQDEVQQVEEVCYICAHSAPNAVLLGCGHSGLCYACAELLVKRKRSGVPECIATAVVAANAQTSSVQHVVILPTNYTDIAIGEMFVVHNGISLGNRANASTTATAGATVAATLAVTAGATAINTPV
eukprot:1785-Heterococcus_DN1.PRE.3